MYDQSMIYEYQCQKCDHTFDIVKKVADIDNPEVCEKCNSDAIRLFRPRIYLNNTSVQHAEYNPGLGCVVRNRDHAKEIAKQKGMVEIGNDFASGHKMQKGYDNEREEKFNKSYDDTFKEAVEEHESGVYKDA